ncbi:MAG: putative lipid II flippase FtsW [Deltaproteobacteria bacterium]|nr:putative lipid II flippase FtsW [Deltaproteobacteria bacterium]
MIRLRDVDRLLILTTLFLSAMGILMVYSASNITAMTKYGDEYLFVKKHMCYLFAGIVVLMVFMRLPYDLYRRLAYPIFIVAAVLLALIFVPGLGHEAGGSRRWIRLGPFTFQPSESAKLATVVFLAYSLSARQARIKTFSPGFLPNMVFPGILSALILAEPDLGATVSIASLVFLMCITAGVKYRYLTALFVVGAALMAVVVANFDYMKNRWDIFFSSPWSDPHGSGHQMIQSYLGFGSGGLWGVGLGEGKQKLFYLPEAHTDFILSVIGEEMGLVGVGVVIALYVTFLFCGTRIALKSRDLFGMYLALGITYMVVLQAVWNMAVVMGLSPTKGLTLPFISYGGTSLMVNMISVGVLLNVYIKANES